jgi:heme/copper-type cytochrome/quinol oxidase subunit 2
MIWVGGVVTLSALAVHIRRGGELDAVRRFIGSLRVVGPVVFAPGPLVLLGTGIWSVTRNDAWGFGQTWVWLSLVLLGGAFLFGAAVQSRVAIGAERAATAGQEEEAVRLLGRWTQGSLLILILLLVATWDMVAKPGL